MLFHSYTFLFLFFPVTLALYLAVLHWFGRPQALWLIILASLGFYAAWRPSYLPLLVGSIAVNYLFAYQVARSSARAQGWWLAIGIALNLALLGWFKYATFIATNLKEVAGLPIPVPEITLPLAISFFTFQQIAFLVDVRRLGRLPSIRDYSAAVSFFPHLIAGPIVQYRDLLPQLQEVDRGLAFLRRTPAALFLLSMGLFKKLVIAERFSEFADLYFGSTASAGVVDSWFGVLAFALQIYFDFSAYTDMALGIALFFGIALPQNFDSPYRSATIIDFWRRWHITLSAFLRDYLYIPLGGKNRRYRNLMITMLLGGLWHGAGWNFILWGGLHGAYLCVNHAWKKLARPLPEACAAGLTFFCVLVAWVPFRANTLSQTLTVWNQMVGRSASEFGSTLFAHSQVQNAIISLAVGMVIVALPMNSQHWAMAIGQWEGRKIRSSFAGVATGALFVIALLYLMHHKAFLYFNF
jgi:alginate O-acetyltransferase complex protein AlgI